MTLFKILFILLIGIQSRAQQLCLDWQQTNFPGSCARTGIQREGMSFVDVNGVPIPFFTASTPTPQQQQSFLGCFDKVHLLLGDNFFHFYVTVGDPEGRYGPPTPKQDYCTHMYHAVMLKLATGENILLFGVTHAGTAVDGHTKINLSLSKIDPALAAELHKYMEELKSQIEQIERLNSAIMSPDDIEKQNQELDAIDNQVRYQQKADVALSEAAQKAIDEINAIRHKFPNKHNMPESSRVLRRIYTQLQTLHSGHVNSFTLPDLAKLVHENRNSFKATDLWNLSEFIEDISLSVHQPKLSERVQQIQNDLQNAKNRLDQKIGQKSSEPHLGAQAFHELAKKSLADLQQTVSGNEVTNRAGFLSAYRSWLAKQLLASKTLLNNPSISRADLVALEQTNYEIQSFVARFYDEKTGWLLRTNVPSELKTAINQLIQIDALRGKKLQEALNLWSKSTEVTPQQKLVSDTLLALINGFQADSASGGLEFEEVTRFNALLQQGIEAVKQTSTLGADIGIGIMPFVGDFKDFCEATTGKRLCLPGGENLTSEDRVYAAVGMIAGTGSFWKAIGKSTRGILASISDIISGKRLLASKKHWNKMVKLYKVPLDVADALIKHKWGLPEEVFKKIPWDLVDPPKLNRKAPGLRWLDPKEKGIVSIRIDKGDPKSVYPHQKVDHVSITKNGKSIDKSGNIIASKETSEAHIPLSEWINWSHWWKP